MREIKFRAWLPKARKTVWSDYGTAEQRQPDGRKRGRMVEFDELYFDISHDSLEHPQLFTDTPEHFYGEDIDKSAEGAVLMQYTGLKDKNRVEIYESDIVKAASQGIVKNCEVRWGKGTAGFFLYHPTSIVWRLAGGGKDYDQEVNAEIIGNIYENPDLLT